jgi:alpha-maltose-1-phosphate synthase
MKILLFSNYFVDYSVQLANSLQEKGESVYLFMIEPSFDTFDHLGSLHRGIRHFTYKIARLYSPMNFLLLYRLLKEIITYKPDVIHFQGASFRNSLLFPVLKVLRYPLVITFHDPVPHSGENTLTIRFANAMGRAFADAIIVHGEFLKAQVMERYNYPGIRIQVTRSGEHQVTPFIHYRDESVREDPHVILFFGRIQEYKGLRFLIEAEPMITREIPDAKIIIAGAGQDFSPYSDMMVNKDHFVVYNYLIPYELGATLFQKASLVVLPYTDASQSGVVHTAYGFKKAVVVTDVGSIPEIVDNNVTGMIVPAGNAQALADAIVHLLTHDSLRHQMGMNGYNKLKKDLSWGPIAEEVIGIYNKCIKRYKRT